MTIFNLIHEDHLKIDHDLNLIAEGLRQPIPDLKEIERSYLALKRNLLVHMLSEEESVYNHLREKPETKLFSYEGDEQHEIIHTLLDKLEDEEIDLDGRWQGTFTVLRDLIRQHVLFEESQVFSEMQLVFSAEQLRSMAVEMKEEKLVVSESLQNAFLDDLDDAENEGERASPSHASLSDIPTLFSKLVYESIKAVVVIPVEKERT